TASTPRCASSPAASASVRPSIPHSSAAASRCTPRRAAGRRSRSRNARSTCTCSSCSQRPTCSTTYVAATLRRSCACTWSAARAPMSAAWSATWASCWAVAPTWPSCGACGWTRSAIRGCGPWRPCRNWRPAASAAWTPACCRSRPEWRPGRRCGSATSRPGGWGRGRRSRASARRPDRPAASPSSMAGARRWAWARWERTAACARSGCSPGRANSLTPCPQRPDRATIPRLYHQSARGGPGGASMATGMAVPADHASTRGNIHVDRQQLHHRRTQARRQRHRLPRGPGRPADRPHHPAHRALQDPQAGPPQPARPADDGQPPPQPPRLPASQGRRALQGPDPEAGPASVSVTRTAARQHAPRFCFSRPPSRGQPPAAGAAPRSIVRCIQGNHVAKITKTFQYGKHEVTLETGEIARQAGGAVMVKCAGTVLLVTAVAAKSQREGQDFFPLTVDYQEKVYAGGRIPGGFFKREGRPTEKETLISRLIDRPIRPLFPEDYKNEVQIIATLMSLNPEVDGDVLALIGASAALSLAGTPFMGPIG